MDLLYHAVAPTVVARASAIGRSRQNRMGARRTEPCMVNFALHRNFPLLLSETSKIEFRFEAFNYFNRAHFGLPGLSVGNRNAGVIGGTAQDNQQLQFGLQLLF